MASVRVKQSVEYIGAVSPSAGMAVNDTVDLSAYLGAKTWLLSFSRYGETASFMIPCYLMRTGAMENGTMLLGAIDGHYVRFSISGTGVVKLNAVNFYGAPILYLTIFN